MYGESCVYPIPPYRCYECGEFGHLSFQCPKNILGDREQPEKKKKKPKTSFGGMDAEGSHDTEDEDEEEVDDWSLSDAVRWVVMCHTPVPYGLQMLVFSSSFIYPIFI